MTDNHYVITLGDDPHGPGPMVVALEYDAAAGCWYADVDGERLAMKLERVEPEGRVRAEIDGETVELTLDAGEHGFRLGFSGEAPLPVRARRPGEIVLASAEGRRDGPELPPEVACPITGVVLEVRVAPGQAVEAGQGLVLLEAMKMETLVKSPAAGVVSALKVAVGDRVHAGATLVELSPR